MDLVTDLTLEEKCRLLGGASTWRTHAIERCDIPAVKMSDGPNGVRGDSVGATRTAGVAIPVGIALGATWNPELLGELGSLLGREAIRKGAHVLLAPTVNLQRTPIGGRVFECYSEDPELTARLAVPFVQGVQSYDVAVTVKHFVANDTEVDRFSVDARVPERALRELYLRPFEAAVREAGAWGVMSSYNRLGRHFCAAHRGLLHDILRDEWGFDGVVVSDWFGSHDTVPSANAGLNIAMPGPATIYGEPLVEAVQSGEVDEATIDALVADVLRLIDRTKARERSHTRSEATVDDPAERALCRRAVTEGLVLLRNEGGALPLDPGTRIALIGPNAATTRIMGGGSSSLGPLPNQSIATALAERLDHAPRVEAGVRIEQMAPPAGPARLRSPEGHGGLLVEYRNGTSFDGPIVATDVSTTSMLRLFGSTPPGVDATEFTITLLGDFLPEVDGPHELSAVITGGGRVAVGDTVVLEDPTRRLPRSTQFFGNGSEEQTGVVDCRAGVPVPVRITSTGRGGFSGVRVGIRPVAPPDLLDRAVAAAADADVAVVVIGSNDEWETEGEDRASITLPGGQDELVAAVAAANPNTVVVINAGSPIAMPWVGDVAAILVACFGGQETGPGVASVLLGETDPGGRLPITYPRQLEDTPAWPHYAPVDGAQVYQEGLLMGYRGFDAAGTEPLFPFGHGLSYGTSTWGDAALSAARLVPGDGVEVTLQLTNDGNRPATEVVQLFVAPVDPPVLRAPKELAAWAKVVVDPGAAASVSITVPPSAFRRWDDAVHGWTVDLGAYDVLVAASAGDIRQAHRVVFEPRSVIRLPAREIPVPTTVSAEAQRILSSVPARAAVDYPALDDPDSWAKLIGEHDESIASMMERLVGDASIDIEDLDVDGVTVYQLTPSDLDPSDRRIYVDIHGGGFIFGRGRSCRLMSTRTAARMATRVWAIDYRMPPHHPFPAGLEDCLTVYREALRDRGPGQVIVGGPSAGGNLAAALMLRARQEGLPLPAALVLMTPAVDLTESGDSIQTNMGLDPMLTSSAGPAFELYAGNRPLEDPLVSPINADLTGFPPTVLTTGTRDLLLSDTIRMHRALRQAGVVAELHVTEAGGHGGFFGMAPEDHAIDREVRAFADRHWAAE